MLIPGANQAPEDLQTAGFLAAVHDRRLDIDVVLVAPQLAHLTDRSVLTRLHTEVVLPARSAGCIAVWFAGISLGGFLTLLYAADHPTELDGLCLLAPYLGNRMITMEINRFRSLADWSAGNGRRPRRTGRGASNMALYRPSSAIPSAGAIPRLWPGRSLCNDTAPAGKSTVAGGR